MPNSNKNPIFFHSLFRSGSTYLFNVFRRSSSGYWCYQEPLNEYLLHAASEPDRLLDINKEAQNFLRHPELKAPYFYEFHTVADDVGRYFQKEFPYDQYFTKEKDDFTALKTYFAALQNGSQGRPVFQCCRTTGRVAGLKQDCGGKHIFLWRNPWEQWWSYKKDSCFEESNLLILSAKNLPSFFGVLKKELKLQDFYDVDLLNKSASLSRYMLGATDSYKLFYALWCHAMLEAKPHCELSISIDQLSNSNAYRTETLEVLEKIGIAGLEFSDCSVPIAIYGESDGAFFLEIENYVHELLLLHGYSKEQVNDLKQLSDERKKLLVDSSAPENSTVRDAMRAREHLVRAETKLAEVQSMLLNAEVKTQQAEAETQQAEAETQQAANMVQMVFDSHSWRITAPLRWLGKQFSFLRQYGLVARIKVLTNKLSGFFERGVKIVKNTIRLLMQHSITFLNSRPGLKHQCVALIRKLGLYKPLRSIYLRLSSQPRHLSGAFNQRYIAEPIAGKYLTPRTLRVYEDLKAAIEKRHKENN